MSQPWTLGAMAGALHAVTGVDHLAVLLPCSVGHPASVAWKTGANWGLGHGIGASLFGLVAFQAKETLFAFGSWARFMELTVGLTLIVIGGSGLIETAPSRMLCATMSRYRVWCCYCCSDCGGILKLGRKKGERGERGGRGKDGDDDDEEEMHLKKRIGRSNSDGDDGDDEDSTTHRKRKIGKSASSSQLNTVQKRESLLLPAQGANYSFTSEIESPSSLPPGDPALVSGKSSSTSTSSSCRAEAAVLLLSHTMRGPIEIECEPSSEMRQQVERSHGQGQGGQGTMSSTTMIATGIIHGMSGAGHLVGVIPALTLPTTLQVVLYLSSFCIGTLMAMSAFTSLVGYASMKMNATVGSEAVILISRLSSGLSVLIGLWFVSKWAVEFRGT